ncbi:4-coumarate--CoA ligase 3 [Aphelenchoides bicaudatus]|nr:4-coumarate--CoA ligase 3 [Aphelenchoides bicaudatus]
MVIQNKEAFIQHKIADVPLVCERNFSEQFLEALWTNSKHNPTRPAFINAHNPQDRVTYAELYNASMSVAAFVESRGLQKGDVCCLILPSNWEYMASFAGITYAGGIITGTSMLFTSFELARQINDSGSKIVFCSDKKIADVVEAIKSCPKVELVVVVKPYKAPKEYLPLGFVDFRTVLDTPPSMKSLPKIDSKDLLMLPYSSGTTGIPKGTMITHQNFGTMMNAYIWYNRKNVYEHILPGFEPRNEHHLLILPFYHIFGAGIVTSALMEGFTVVGMQQFMLDLYCQCIQDYKIKQLYFVPPVAIALAKSPIVDRYDLSSLNNTCSGAAPLGDSVCQELKQRLKLKYVGQGYGLTEISMAGYLPNTARESFSACGYLVPTLEMKIIDIQTGQALPPHKKGEVCFRGPTIFKGYLNRPRATAETIDNEGWMHTGDVGYLDELGQLFLVDRIKELIKVKGFQVAPAELEDVLLSHPMIADCAVIGVLHPKLGEVPKAFVVKKDDKLTEKGCHRFHSRQIDRLQAFERRCGIHPSSSEKSSRQNTETRTPRTRKGSTLINFYGELLYKNKHYWRFLCMSCGEIDKDTT